MKIKLHTALVLSAALTLCTLATYAEAITLTPTSCVPAPACSSGAEILAGGNNPNHTFPPISFTFTLPQPVTTGGIFDVKASGDLNNTTDTVTVMVGATNVGILNFPAIPALVAANCNQFNRNTEAPITNLVCPRPEKVGKGGDLVDADDPNPLVSVETSIPVDKSLLTGATIVLSLVPSGTMFDIAFQAETLHIPEPATWLLFGFGLVGLAGWRRRRHAA
jgi:PEP-CTERM motif